MSVNTDPAVRRVNTMKAEYDFSRGKRGAVLSSRGKTRITIYLDDTILERFKAESARTGKGYQTLINEALAQNVNGAEPRSRRARCARSCARNSKRHRAGGCAGKYSCAHSVRHRSGWATRTLFWRLSQKRFPRARQKSAEG